MFITTIRDIRTAIFELRAPAAASLHADLLETVTAVAETLGFMPTLEISGPLDHAVPDALRPEILAVVIEALSNVVRHAQAHRVKVTVGVTGDLVTVRVTDDGVGFDDLRAGGNGLSNMRQRAARFDGRFDMEPVEPHGTEVIWSVPLSTGPGPRT